MHARTAALVAGLGAAAMVACAPALDWRDVRLAGTALVAQFPCKPASHARRLGLAGRGLEFTLYACSTASATWAIGWAEGIEPAQMGDVLLAMRSAAAANVGAQLGALEPAAVPGATPNAQAGRSRVSGRRPDGEPLVQDTLVFAHGLKAFQATVLSVKAEPAAIEHFYSELRIAP